MPHKVEVWDRSDFGSDTIVPVTTAQLGLDSDSEEDESREHDNGESSTRMEQPQGSNMGHESNEITVQQDGNVRPQRNQRHQLTTKAPRRSLPARGYLFEEKADTHDIMDPKDMGLTVLQARRKGRLEAFKAPIPYMEAMKTKLQRMEDKRDGRPDEDGKHWGDEPTYRSSWPKVDKRGAIRIMYYNVNGISALDDFIEMEMLMQTAAQEQVDILMISEINLNLYMPGVRARLTQAVKQYDKYAKVQIAHPPENPHTTRTFNMGGNMIIVQGALAGRVGNQGADSLGRWSWMELKCDDSSIILTCAYRVGKGKGTIGGTSIAQQEIRGLMKQNHSLATKPRAAFDLDMANFSVDMQNKGHKVLVMMDANSPVDSAENRTFLTSAGLRDVASNKHPGIPMPRTFQAGSKCIDEAACSPDLMDWISAYGFYPFFRHGLYDHRGQLLELDCTRCLDKFVPDLTRRQNHKLKTSRPSECKAYCSRLKALLKKAGIFTKIDDLYKDLYSVSGAILERRIKKIIKYNQVARDLMIAAENSLGPKSPLIEEWSPAYKYKGQELSYYNKCLESDNVNGDLGTSVPVPKSVQRDKSITSREDLEKKRLEVKLSWNQVNSNKPKLRRDFLREQAQQATETRNVEYESALKQIINTETSRALHARHGGVLKSNKKTGGITSILVPNPRSDIPLPGKRPDDDGWMSIDNDTWINNLFAAINRRKLCMSNGSAMAPGGVLNELIGPHGISNHSDAILDGDFDVDQLTPIEGIDIETLKEFVRQMARPRHADGSKIPDMEWTFDADDYCSAFSKKNERTSCGPSGLHMSHWKAMCQDKELCNLFARFIEMPFRLGFTYPRWETSFHTMIMKKAKPWANAMRIVQLLEGDYNAGLRFLVQRCVSAYAEANSIYGESTYGGRKGKNTHQVLGQIQATNEYCRIGRIPAALADVDAKNCFDCMTHAGIGFFQRRQGSPKNLVECQCTNLSKMKHYIKTGRGVSKNHITAPPGSTLEGSGQGAGASVGNWQGHNDPMIRTYEKRCQPCTTANPDGLHMLQQWVASFVDDNKLSMTFAALTELEYIYTQIGNGVSTWREILRLTGGDLELDKSYIGILSYDFNTFQPRYMGRRSPHKIGVPLLQSSTANDYCVKLDQNGRDIILQELDPDQGLRLLGVRMSLSGDFTDEFQYRAEQVAEMASRIRTAALDSRDGWLIYQTRYRPMLRYCLPITTFSASECSEIQRPFIGALINCLGMNRNTKRVVCFGPLQFGGMNIMDAATEQFASRMHLMMTNIRKGNPTGRSLIHQFSMYQIYLGCEKPFLSVNPALYPCLSSKTHVCQYVWEELRRTNTELLLQDMWTPVKVRDNDVTIIDACVALIQSRQNTPGYINPIKLYQANACRLYLRVTWLSEICTHGGNRIAPWAYKGSSQSQSKLKYPFQPKPPESAWEIWREFLRCAFVATGRMQLLPYCILPLHREIGHMLLEEVPSQTKTTAPRTSSLSEIVQGMTRSWRQVLGDVVFPVDDGQALAQIIRNGETVRCWSDGSVKNGVGSHAFTLRTHCEDNDMAITGDAPTPGHPDDISSLRSEHYGGLACVILMWALEYKYELPPGGYCVLHIDNMEVVNRIKFGVPTNMAAEKFTKTDFDVWQETSELSQQLGLSLCARWVKGHQDKFIEGVYAGIGPMSLEAKFNIQMDRRAEKRRLASVATLHNIPFDSEKATLVVNGSIVTTNAAEYITYARTSPAMITYIIEKTGWTESTFHKVDWDAMGQYMKAVSIGTRAKAVKLQHNWQNTGRQKGLFMTSAGATAEVVHEVSRCPMGCGDYEAPLHYLQCTKNPNGKEMQDAIRGINKWLPKQGTAPALTSIMTRILYKFTQNKLAELKNWNFDNERNSEELYDLVKEQEEIGWNNFFKGRISRRWGEIQESFFVSLDLPDCQAYKTGLWWASNVIRQLTYFSLNSWQIRNDALHKDKLQNTYNEERKELRCRVRWWYNQEKKLESSMMKKYFKKSMLSRATDTNQSLACWIDSVEMNYKYAIDRGEERGTIHVPPPRVGGTG